MQTRGGRAPGQCWWCTTGRRFGPCSKNVGTCSNTKPGSSCSAPLGKWSRTASESDARDRARERRARADVRAVPEREVLVGVRAVEVELVGSREDALVSVRARRTDRDPLAGVDRAAADLRVAHAAAREEQDRRREPEALLDRDGDTRAIRAQRGLGRGRAERLVQQVAEELAGRREATGDEVAHEGAQLLRRQGRVVDLEADEAAEHVVGRVIRARFELRAARRDAIVDVAGELRERGREADAALGAVEGGEGALHELLRPARDLVGNGGVEAEQVHRHPVRQHGRVRRDEIEAVGREGAEQRGRGLGDEGLGGVDDLGRHRSDHHSAHGGVARRVQLAEEAVFLGDLHSRSLHPRRVGERLGVAQHRARLLVTRHVPQTARKRRDRALGAEFPQRVPRVAGHRGVEGVEHGGSLSSGFPPPGRPGRSEVRRNRLGLRRSYSRVDDTRMYGYGLGAPAPPRDPSRARSARWSFVAVLALAAGATLVGVGLGAVVVPEELGPARRPDRGGGRAPARTRLRACRADPVSGAQGVRTARSVRAVASPRGTGPRSSARRPSSGRSGSSGARSTSCSAFETEAASSTLAYYDPDREEIIVRGTTLDVAHRVTIAHELTHVLQDQHFDLRKLEERARASDVGDTSTVKALIEGDARRIEQDYLERLTPAERKEFTREDDAEGRASERRARRCRRSSACSARRPTNGAARPSGCCSDPGATRRWTTRCTGPAPSSGVFVDAGDVSPPVAVDAPLRPAGAVAVGPPDSFGPFETYLMLAMKLDPVRALDAADTVAGGSGVAFRTGTKTCYEVALAPRFEHSRAFLLHAVQDWARSQPDATVDATGDEVGFTACDAGVKAPAPPTAPLDRAVDILSLRSGLAVGVARKHESGEFARCEARVFVQSPGAPQLVLNLGDGTPTDPRSEARIRLGRERKSRRPASAASPDRANPSIRTRPPEPVHPNPSTRTRPPEPVHPNPSTRTRPPEPGFVPKVPRSADFGANPRRGRGPGKPH